MKILQVFSRYLQYGGEEDVVNRFGQTLARRFQVGHFIKSSEDLIGTSLSDKWKLPFRTFHNASVIDELRALQQTESYDAWLIHNVFPAISPSAYSLARELGVPVVHYLHNYRFGCSNGYLFTAGSECRKCLHGNFVHGAIGKCWRGSRAQSSAMAMLLTRARHQQKIFEHIDHFIAISEAQKQIHVEMGIPEDKITVVHHYLPRSSAEAPPPFPVDGHALFLGRLSREKGVDRLIEAWALLPQDRKLVIAGSGPMEEELRNLASSRGLSNVQFAGFLDKEAQQEIWKGTLFSVVPSVWQEPFGMVVLEAWAKGRPVVAHRIGALPEIISDGENGFLADPGSPETLADAIRRAYDHLPKLPAMGQQGSERLHSYFHEERWLEEITAVFVRLEQASPAARNRKESTSEGPSPTDARPLRVAAVFVTMNRAQTALTCLKQLATQTRLPDRVLVIDNASTDDTREQIEAFISANPALPITLLALPENLGNAGGMEVALEEVFAAEADAAWILDDDSWPEHNALELLLDANVPENALRSSRVVDLNEEKLSWPLQIRKHGRWSLIETNQELPKQALLRIRRSWLGALVTRSIFDTVGNVDGRLFLRGEDEDYPRRIENAGIPTYLVRDSVLHHPAVQKLHKLRIFGNEVVLEDGLTGDKLYYRLRNSWWSTKRDRGFLSLVIIASLHGLLLQTHKHSFPGWRPIWREALRDARESRLGKRSPR